MCHNYGVLGHNSRYCTRPGGGGNEAGNFANEEQIPGVYIQALHLPPQGNDSKERTFPDSTVVYWYSECRKWKDYFRVDHTTAHDTANLVDGGAGSVGIGIVRNGDNNVVAPEMVQEPEVNVVVAAINDGAMSRLRADGLL